MPYCSNCGDKVEVGVRFCPNCGSPQAVGAGPPSRSPPTPTTKQRPSFVKVLILADFVIGAVLLILGLLVFFTPAAPFGLLLLVVGFASGAVGYGLLKARGWVRLIGTLTGIGFLVAGFLLVILPNPYLTALGAVTFILGVGSLVFLRLPRAKAYLGE